ncbi:MAG: hypothetical protein HQ446_02515, partial [Polaromonas sp.]|nr:hypothetical protein [Polaromonas sp.]
FDGDYALQTGGDSIVAQNYSDYGSGSSGGATIDISGINGGLATTAETLEMRASGSALTVAMTLAQNNSFEVLGGIIAVGSDDTVHITDTGTVNANAAVENYELSSGANTFYFATGLAIGSAGQTVTASGGTLTVFADRTSNGSGGYVPLIINDAAPSGATDITLDITSYSGGFSAEFGDMNLQYVDHLAVTANSAGGVHWGDLPGGGPISVNIIADRYNAVHDSFLFGTTGNDSIQGGFGHDTVDIRQGGNDTLVFTPGASVRNVSVDMTIIGFTADNTVPGGYDSLDFTAFNLVSNSGLLNSIHYGTIDADAVFLAAPVGGETGATNEVNVWGFTNLTQAENATFENVASAIRGYTNEHFLVNDKMIFLIASSEATDGAVNTGVYFWDDSIARGAGDTTLDAGRVNASELTKIGVLNDFYQLDIASLTNSNFVEHGVPT